MKLFVIFVLSALVLQAGSAHALSTPQEQMTITIEAGRSYTFQLVIQNSDASNENLVIDADGIAGDWMRFGEDKQSAYEVSIPPISTVVVPVSVSAPIDTDTMEYQASINTENGILLSVNVRVTPPLEDIRTLEGSSTLDSQIDRLEQEIINVSQNIVDEVITGNQNLDSRISVLEEGVKSSSKQLTQGNEMLQDKLNSFDGITGNIAFGSSVASFVIGVIVAFFAIQLFSNKRALNLKRKKKEGFEFAPKA